MRRITHLSDVHFGTVDPAAAEFAIAAINRTEPDVVVVSGDLTQRAKSSEFKAAKAFLDRLPHPQIVVPGNHDVPAYNLFARFFSPLTKYKRYSTPDLSPMFFDEELAIVGINTARSLVIKGGRINDEQIECVRDQMCSLSDDILKILVTHHPFDLPENSHHDDVVGRAEIAMPKLAECGGDLLLSGHLHVGHIDTTAKRYPLANGRNALVVQAGTATSTRVRGEPHSFNVIEFDRPELKITRLERRGNESEFVPVETKRYAQAEHGWARLDQPK